jgi:hypothetical protein
MKRELRTKSVGTKVSEAELRVLESRAERAGLTLSEWVRDVLRGSSVEMGTLAAERAILAEVLQLAGWLRRPCLAGRSLSEEGSVRSSRHKSNSLALLEGKPNVGVPAGLDSNGLAKHAERLLPGSDGVGAGR